MEPRKFFLHLADLLRADDIDESKAERAKELALRNQENAESDMDFSRAKAELAEASARLQALRKLRKK